ncbi:histone acetyltransferase [Niveomyces insectorum RCEF 264]|uniref:Histone acetyltransferase n=1 Tax=Niveomyces insectorum RCEF 264 TaxID=1081102 RepID=A0A162KAI4_9HYPO|nr:histone acetyltransferase [Niveomyces insectorum RCEF 264]
MPAIMDDPEAATIYRVSGALPYPDPQNPSLPPNVVPRQVTLRDRQTVATIVPFASRAQVPPSLLLYLSDQFRKEIEGGDTYPMVEPLPFEKFANYWFQNFGAIMLLGRIEWPEEVVEGRDWSKDCLGSFYIKPNYPGRSSHVCNAGFLVTDASRNRGVGRLMGETYLDWAPKLGYTYSVFNLVYETNVASCKIWDGLGFKRIGRVKGCGNLKSYPGRLVDAIIYGRDLVQGGDADDLVSDDRFDKIKFYLKYGEYPNGADRAEKSRLRSAATTYKLLDGDVLMLKDKEVVSNPDRQFAIAREIHLQQHAGINKTTATIAERYHWTRIKDTVSDVIRNCTHCKEPSKTALPHQLAATSAQSVAPSNTSTDLTSNTNINSNNIVPTTSDTSTMALTSSSSIPAPNASSLPPSASIVPIMSSSTPMEQDGKPPDDPTHPQAHTLPQPHPQSSHIHNSPSPQLGPPPPSPPHPAFTVTLDGYKGINGPASAMSIGQMLRAPTESPIPPHAALPGHNPMLQDQPRGLHQMQHPSNHALDSMLPLPAYQPIDPKIISQPSPPGQHHHQLDHHHQLHYPQHGQAGHTHASSSMDTGAAAGHHAHHQLPHHLNQPSSHLLNHHHHHSNNNPHHHGDPFASFHEADAHSTHHQLNQLGHHPQHHHTAATDAFTSLLNATDDDDGFVGSDGPGSGNGGGISASGVGGSSGNGGDGGAQHHTHSHAHIHHTHNLQLPHSYSAVHDARGVMGIDDDEAEREREREREREAAVDRDLDMLIEPPDEDEDDNNANTHNTSSNTINNGSNSSDNVGSHAQLALHNQVQNHGNGAAGGGGHSYHHGHDDMSHAMAHDLHLGGHPSIHDDAVDNIAGVVDDVNLGGNGDGHDSQHGGHGVSHGTSNNMLSNSGISSSSSNNNNNNNSGGSGNSNNTALRSDTKADVDTNYDAGNAGANRFVSKMDIGRLLSSAEEAARGGDGGSGADGKQLDDDRLDDMQFGSGPS